MVTKKQIGSHLPPLRRAPFHDYIVCEVVPGYEVSIYQQDAPNFDVCPRLAAVVPDRHVLSIHVEHGERELDGQDNQGVVC